VKVEKNFDHISSKVSVISSVREPHQTSKLEDAKTVVAGGRGLKHSEGFNYVRELALLLGGEIGATRPAVDAHWTSHEQLIGQTGRSVKPELLITCGTSGAVQYTAGMRGAGTIVAINRDPHAPIFKVGFWGGGDACPPTCLILEVKNHFPGDCRSLSHPGQRERRSEVYVFRPAD
jgi:electron transfer flavoprotein alpha subunit